MQEEFPTGVQASCVGQREASADIENSGTLSGRPFGHPIETGLLVARELSGALGNVQGNGRTRTAQLIGQIGPVHKGITSRVGCAGRAALAAAPLPN